MSEIKQDNTQWKEYRLGEVTLKIGSGATPRGGSNVYKNKGISLIRSQNVWDLQFITAGLVFIDDEQASKLKNVIVEDKDVLLNITGDSVARACIVPINILPARVNQHVAIIRANTQITLPNYILYNLIAQKEELLSYSEIGATRRALTKGMIEQLELNLPPLPEQHAIASVLSSLDDKIDLLQRQNTTLEKMAETLFRQWFVEEADDEWEEVKLSRIVDIFNGVSYKSVDLNPSTIAMVTLKSFNRNGGFQMSGFKEYTGKYREHHVINSGEIAVAHTDLTQNAEIIGNPVVIPIDHPYQTLLVSMDLVKVLSKNEKIYSNEFLYLLFKSRDFKEHALAYTNGSTVIHLSKKAIPEYITPLPGNSIIIDFTYVVRPLFNKIKSNQVQIRTLTQLRDTLLPKLMSGELRVGYQ